MAVRLLPGLSGSRRAAAAAAALAVALSGAACSGGSGTDPSSARTCEELVARAARVAAEVVTELGEVTAAELQLRYPDDPFAALTEPFEPFARRAEQLGCDPGELRRLACSEYLGLRPEGPLAEEFLAEVRQRCP